MNENNPANGHRVWRVLFCGHAGTAAYDFACMIAPMIRAVLPADIGLDLIEEASPVELLKQLERDHDMVVLMFNPSLAVCRQRVVRRQFPEGHPERAKAEAEAAKLPNGCAFLRTVRTHTTKPIVVIQNGQLELDAGPGGIEKAGASLVLDMPFNLATAAGQLAPFVRAAGLAVPAEAELEHAIEDWSKTFNVVVAINEPNFRDIFVMCARNGDWLPQGTSIVCLAADEAGEVLGNSLVANAGLVVVLINNLWFDVAPKDLAYPDQHFWLIRELRAQMKGFLLVASGYWGSNDLELPRAAGADLPLALPYSYAELSAGLRQAVERWRAGVGASDSRLELSPLGPGVSWWDGRTPSIVVGPKPEGPPPPLDLLRNSGQDAAVRRTRPPRIVMLDDVSGVLEMLTALMRGYYPDAEILTFAEAHRAYAELLRQPPDLFTTDVCHAPPDGDDLLRMLSARPARYPIFVISSCVSTPDMLRPGSIGPGMNVSFLPKPFRAEEFVQLLQQRIDPRLID